jgi:hypothetical protein
MPKKSTGKTDSSKVGINDAKSNSYFNKIAKNWCFTLNNPEEDFHSMILISRHIKRFIYQLERGHSGTEHLQGFIEFDMPVKPHTVFFWNNRIHWEVCKHVSASILYCQKLETRVQGPWVKNIIPDRPLCDINPLMLFPWQKFIVDIISKTPDPRKIFWFWEPIGNSGKSTFAKFLVLFHNAIVLSGKSSDMKNAIATCKNYPNVIVIDVPRASNNFISFQGIEEIKNGLFFSGKYDSKMVCGPVPHVFVLSNIQPDTSLLSIDRWAIYNIREHTF